MIEKIFLLGKDKPIIDPMKYAKKENIVLPTYKCILTFSSRTTKQITTILNDPQTIPIKIPLLDPTLGTYNNEKIYIATLSIGAPASTLSLELLIGSGAKKIIIIGGAGSIHPDIKIGDILIPTWGLREEGTSYHYMPPEYIPKPDSALKEKLKKEIESIKQEDINIIEGGIWSIDAIFRETRDKVRAYRREGIIGVDMESTALMTVAHYRGIALAIALIITDELRDETWTYEWESEKIIRSEKIAALGALKALI
ncbi:MAG: nucleoside phosphorylase [Candidatus Njordarchaeota archaeon]